MEQKIQEKILNEVKRIQEDCLYSEKGHFNAAQRWGNIHLWLGIPAVILAAIAGASALSQFDNHNIIAGILAIIVSALSAVATFLNPNEKANNHHYAGNQYKNLRNSARILSEIDIHLIIDDKEILRELKDLNKQRSELNQKLPQISRWAYKKAKEGIRRGEAKYEIDEEKQFSSGSVTKREKEENH